jgi:hypothetical protein
MHDLCAWYYTCMIYVRTHVLDVFNVWHLLASGVSLSSCSRANAAFFSSSANVTAQKPPCHTTITRTVLTCVKWKLMLLLFLVFGMCMCKRQTRASHLLEWKAAHVQHCRQHVARWAARLPTMPTTPPPAVRPFPRPLPASRLHQRQ